MGTSLLIQLVNSRLTLGLVVLLPSDVGGSGLKKTLFIDIDPQCTKSSVNATSLDFNRDSLICVSWLEVLNRPA